MPSQAFIIRASPPPRGEDDYADSSTRGRSAKWGLGRQSQPSSSSSSYKGKTRFVRESKASRAWTGDWTREEEVAEKEAEAEAAPSVEKGLLDDAASTEPAPPAHAADDSTASSGSMASLYAQIAARIASAPSTTPVPPATAQPQAGPSSMALPRVLTKRKRAPQAQRSDWFIAKASEQLSRQEARKQQQQQDKASSSSRAPEVAAASTSNIGTQTHPPAAMPSLHPCPTCSQLLPSPCPAPLLRAHLDSIAHRMAQSNITISSTPRPPAATAATTAKAEAPSLPRSLFLDASNAGYRALQAMGWKEGWGMGEEQWRRLQEEVKREEERRIKEEVEKEEERRRRRAEEREVIVVSDSDDEDEEEGDVLFGPLKPPQRKQVEEVSAARDASASRDGEVIHDDKKEQSSSAAQTTEQATEGEAGPTSSLSSHPLLEPIAVQLKRDRLGLGRLRAATGRDYPTLGANASSSSVAESSKKRRREERQAEKKKRRDIVREHERERREWLQLRQSLN